MSFLELIKLPRNIEIIIIIFLNTGVYTLTSQNVQVYKLEYVFQKKLIWTLNLLHPNIFQGTELINPTIYH